MGFVNNTGRVNQKSLEYSSKMHHSYTVNRKRPLLQLEINITPSKVGKISVYEHDQPQKLAISFCQIYQIPVEKYLALKEIIEQTF